VSDSRNVIKELLVIKFNSLYMPLLNDDEVTFTLDFMCSLRRDDCNFSSLFKALELILLFCVYVYCSAFCTLCTIS